MPEEKQYTLDELKKKLTKKESIFCHEYIIDWNGARSARKAGYTPLADRQAAYDTLTKAYIKQYIDFIKDDLEKEAGISKLKQLNTLGEIVEDKEATHRDQISAITETNKMMGYHEPDKLDIRTPGKEIKLNFDE